jgi:uncharacterized damage-inducible protein DinB
MKLSPMTTLLEEAIEAWEVAREGVIEEVEAIPAARFHFRPQPQVRDVNGVVVHIMEIGMMMVGELTREETNFQRMPFAKLVAHYAGAVQSLSGKRALLGALRRTLRDGVREFRRAGEIHMLQRIVRFDGRKGTRLAWFHHGIAHEEYHRGQLTLYAREMGLTPALTRRIQGG